MRVLVKHLASRNQKAAKRWPLCDVHSANASAGIGMCFVTSLTKNERDVYALAIDSVAHVFYDCVSVMLQSGDAIAEYINGKFN